MNGLPVPARAPASFGGMRVALLGFGIEGRDAAAFLAREEAEITVLDRRPAAEIERELDEIGVRAEIAAGRDWARGGADAVMASQGIPRNSAAIRAAECAGLPVYGPMGVFLDRCRARVIGVSGSAGKSTATALLGRIFERAGRAPAVGGNIGRGLLSSLPELGSGDLVVAEISHTQLLRAGRSPAAAVLLNVTPNHLDQFSWPEYVELKRRLVSRQSAGDTAVLPFDEPVAGGMSADTEAAVARFGAGGPPAEAERAAYAADGWLRWRDGGRDAEVLPAEALQIPGGHNLKNALAAVAAAASEGVPLPVIADALREFEGIAHRLELVAEVEGVRYVNDSIATAPERTIAALRAIDGPLTLLLGGRGKDLPMDGLAAEIAARPPGAECRAACFGEAGREFAEAVRRAVRGGALVVDGLEEAVRLAAREAMPGSSVVLSPAGTSFDAYPNFEARGEHFRRLVRELGGGR